MDRPVPPEVRLPGPPELERRCVALAMLDAIISPEWDYRYYSFNRRWDVEAGHRMGSMRNGSGDEYFILFLADGIAALKGFDHESPARRGAASVRGVLDGLPDALAAFANEAAFNMQHSTFCFWNVGQGWKTSATVTSTDRDRDGSQWMLEHLAGGAAEYVEYCRSYFEVEVPVEVVERFLDLEPLTPELARALQSTADLGQLAGDIDEIGYPIVG
jgi:hypothetical protein